MFAIAILCFNAYWFYKSARMAIGLGLGYRRLRRACQFPWRATLDRHAESARVHHLVLVPTCGESDAVLSATLDHLVAQDFPHERIAVFLAFEARDPGARERARRLIRRYQRRFAVLRATFHEEAAGEVRGKSANLAWAGRLAKLHLVDALGWPLETTLVTVCDADSHLHPAYLSALASSFLAAPHRLTRFFQPAMLLYSNIWRVPTLVRVANALHSMWQLGRLSHRRRLITQSTYSASLWLYHAIGYWDVDVIPEDSRIFFKAYFTLGPRVEVEPIYLPVLADAPECPGYLRNHLGQYRQVRRWAWGVVDIPYVVLRAIASPQIPLVHRIQRVLPYVEDHIFWPGNWFLLSLGSAMPRLLHPDLPTGTLGQALSTLSSLLLTGSLVGVLAALVVDGRLRPSPPGPQVLTRVRAMAEWVLMPLVGLIFTALPAVDAHTRLLLGRSLEFQVTEKRPASTASRHARGRLAWVPRNGGRALPSRSLTRR